MAVNVKEQYHRWMRDAVGGSFEYNRLLTWMENNPFRWDISPYPDINERDSSRVEKGISLRYRFGYLHDYSNALIAEKLDCSDPSILEVLLALSIDIEENIMGDDEKGNRVAVWFWEMMLNLGMDHMDNPNFDEDVVKTAFHKMMSRTYAASGFGSLFPQISPKYDMRKIDIWWQAQQYYRERFDSHV